MKKKSNEKSSDEPVKNGNEMAISLFSRLLGTLRLLALDRRNGFKSVHVCARACAVSRGRTAGSEYTFIYSPAVLFMDLIVIVK